ncbi:parallel beta-helix repeat protein [Fontibacillus phaseoli]|uniref:Parallel beta-helix repeat protein n=1 Tax=Fontibacillus phaseoli TaxID=1416533 RepID=A0A369BDE5_9BACL|nr:right-handed parallel beta-helix repeat-containing protein [Fontibacillus phaseoli]RCX19592.1 parallel beta-helix repeat protein [Fontibacillus phaseoli]
MEGKGVQQVDNGVISIDNASYVRVTGLEIRHYNTSSADVTPIGIHVSGSGRNIEIIGNRIHDMGTNAGQKAGGGNAHGIAVYGNSAASINKIDIIQNELYNLKLGASEAMAINGNVDGFRVMQNIVHDNNNIGIDIIGFEGIAPNPVQDQARNGVIQENQVYNNSSYGNPAYGNDYSAAGIYVDGGKDMKIIDNNIHDNDFGIELASEHAGGVTSNVEVSLNRIYNNSAAGITLGGYDEDRGRTENSIIKENKLTENNSKHLGYGEINLAFDTRNNELRNNYIEANEDGLMITNEFTQNEGNKVDFNHYSSKNQAHWIWKGEEFDDFRAYRTQTGNDLHSDLN